MINILAQDFHIWQYLGSNRSEAAATALNHHTLNSGTQNLPTHAQQYPTNHAF